MAISGSHHPDWHDPQLCSDPSCQACGDTTPPKVTYIVDSPSSPYHKASQCPGVSAYGDRCIHLRPPCTACTDGQITTPEGLAECPRCAP